jgi:hypothetical protein
LPSLTNRTRGGEVKHCLTVNGKLRKLSMSRQRRNREGRNGGLADVELDHLILRSRMVDPRGTSVGAMPDGMKQSTWLGWVSVRKRTVREPI